MSHITLWLAAQAGRCQEVVELSPECFDQTTLGLALRVAIANDRAGVVRVLLRAGASIECTLWAAARRDSAGAMRALVEANADVNHSYNGVSVAALAASHGANTCLQFLVSSKADLATTDATVCAAAKRGHMSTLLLLLQVKADINVGKPVLWAAHFGHMGAVRVLLKSKADIDVANFDGRTPAFYAACYGHATVLRLLLRAKADARRCTRLAGMSPLFIAATSRHAAAVQCLLAHDPSLAAVATRAVCNVEGRLVPAGSTPLDVSRQFEHDDIVSLLMAATATVTQLK